MATTDVTTIRARMARIRSRAQGKAVRLSQETKQFLDWKHYVRLFPWGVVGAAAIAGYLMVPARQAAPAELAGQESPPAPPPPPEVRRPSLVSSLAGIVANAVMRSAVAYAGQAFGQYLAHGQQSSVQNSTQEHPDHDSVRTR